METKSHEQAKGKIAFIFPAKINNHGVSAPRLNFQAQENKLAISMGISFLQLDFNEKYAVTFKLTSPSGGEVITYNGISEIPSNEIHPEWRTSFLSANFVLDVDEYGVYKFTCHLISMLNNYEHPIDTKEILFNIFDAETAHG